MGCADHLKTQAETEKSSDSNAAMVRLVHSLYELGPNIPEIARKLGQYRESVRYRYKEKLLKKGFAVQAMVNHEALGLRRVIVVVDFADLYRPYANTILTAMNELCYLTGFARTLPEGSFVIHASLPLGFISDFENLFEKLKELGLFSNLELFVFDWFRVSRMKAEFYDFDMGRWDFDWSSSPNDPNFEAAAYVPSRGEPFDQIDLLCLKELQIDPNRTLADIAKKVQVKYKTLVWHFQTHVLRKNLIKGYSVNWMGTSYNYELDKALHRKHKYIALDVLVKDLKPIERMELLSKVDRLPFLWSEALGKNYYCQIAIPTDCFTEALLYLEKALVHVKERVEYYIMDTTNAVAFTVSYQLYDTNRGKWTLNSTDLLARFENLLIKIRGSSG
jgi:DNA-binding Lrp family transcriptional regulator